MNQQDAIYQNRATLDTASPLQDCSDCEECHDLIAFALEDNHHKFSLGLSTVLECLAIAEREGYVPKLPFQWWLAVSEK